MKLSMAADDHVVTETDADGSQPLTMMLLLHDQYALRANALKPMYRGKW